MLWPAPFEGLAPAIPWLLGLVMFGMGATLSARDFSEVAKRPALVGLGVLLQFGGMPAMAFLIARVLGLSPELTAGLVLVGTCPGGTASNVICYLARADVALSISLTVVSTLLAVLATPLLTELYVGRVVEFDVLGMMGSVARVVLVPVALGVAVNHFMGSRLDGPKRWLPSVSVLAIVLIIAIVVSLSRDELLDVSFAVAVAVVLHNAAGLLLGYGAGRLFGFDERVSRTLAIEVGMQNSGLGVALAIRYFGAIAALPGALFSVWHNLSGSLLAAYWQREGQADSASPSA